MYHVGRQYYTCSLIGSKVAKRRWWLISFYLFKTTYFPVYYLNVQHQRFHAQHYRGKTTNTSVRSQANASQFFFYKLFCTDLSFFPPAPRSKLFNDLKNVFYQPLLGNNRKKPTTKGPKCKYRLIGVDFATAQTPHQTILASKSGR